MVVRWRATCGGGSIGLSFLAAMLLAAETWAAPSPSHESFASYLARGYREIWALAIRNNAAPALAGRFQERAALAAAGDQLLPQQPGQLPLSAWTKREAGFARQQLLAKLDGGARLRQPLLAALAQVNFDCWVDPLPREIGLPDGDSCRRRFYFALVGLRGGAPEPSPSPGAIQWAAAAPHRENETQESQTGGACPGAEVAGRCLTIAFLGPDADALVIALANPADPERPLPITSVVPPRQPGGVAAPSAIGSSSPGGGTGTAAGLAGGSEGGAATAASGAESGAATGAGSAIGGAAASASGPVSGAATAAGNAVGSAVASAGGALSGAATAAGSAVGGAVASAGGAVSGAATAAGDTASGAGTAAGNAVGGVAASAGNAVGGAVATAGGAVSGAASAAGGALGGALGAAGKAAGGALGGGRSGGLGLGK